MYTSRGQMMWEVWAAYTISWDISVGSNYFAYAIYSLSKSLFSSKLTDKNQYIEKCVYEFKLMRLVGLGVWFSLRVREVPGSSPGRALVFSSGIKTSLCNISRDWQISYKAISGLCVTLVISARSFQFALTKQHQCSRGRVVKAMD